MIITSERRTMAEVADSTFLGSSKQEELLQSLDDARKCIESSAMRMFNELNENTRLSEEKKHIKKVNIVGYLEALHELKYMRKDIVEHDCTNYEVFWYRDYKLQIFRDYVTGHLCGYIEPDDKMRIHHDEEEMDRLFHGGETAGFGFDCAHHGYDFFLGNYFDHRNPGYTRVYRDYNFVKKNLEDVVDWFYEQYEKDEKDE